MKPATRILPALAILAFAAVMWLLPGPRAMTSSPGGSSRAKVIEVDDSAIALHGLIEFGTQKLVVEMPDGSKKNAVNELRAQLEIDKKFKVGDTALVVGDKEPLIARDHWRLGWMGILFGGFSLLLVAFGGWVGFKAVLSFVFSCFAVWKLMIPLCLSGWSACWTSFLLVLVLTAVIVYLVAGWTRKSAAAFFGSMMGIVVSLVLAGLFSSLMNVSGHTMPYVQALYYSGYHDLNIADVFVGALIIGSSGAVMDLAMDIASSCDEVVRHHPSISRFELFRSGLRVGRSVVGTMTTTLLLAYSGGYLTLLMMFAAEGTSPVDFLNSTMVSSEVVKTLVGSFGLVLVSPFTAFVSAMIMTKRGENHGER